MSNSDHKIVAMTRLLHFTDMHLRQHQPGTAGDPARLSRLMPAALDRLADRIKALAPDVVVMTGDVLDVPNEVIIGRTPDDRPLQSWIDDAVDDLVLVKDWFDGTGVAYMVMPGNHDHAVLNDRDVHALLKECGLDIVEESLLTLDIRSKDGGCVKIAAEHGHAGDPYNNYEHPDRAEATSFSQHVWRLFVWPAKSLDRLHDSWMQDIDNVHPVSVIPWWVLSQYFYRDMGWMLKALVVPAAFLFSLTKVGIILLCLRLFGIDLVAAGLPPVPTPLLYLLLGLFGIDLFVFMLLLLLNFVRRDARRALRRWGVDGNLEEALERSRESALIRAGKVLDETQADMYLFGHTHEEHIGCRNAQVICNVGTWTKRMRRIRSRFHLPPVFVPEFRLTYARISASDEGVIIELRQRPMHVRPELTYLQRFATIGRVQREHVSENDRLLDEVEVRSPRGR